MRSLPAGRWTSSGLPCFQVAEVRLRSARRYLRLLEKVVDEETREPTESQYEFERRRRYPYLRSEPIDMDALSRWSEATDEFPLLAWSTALAHAFSVLESLLDSAVAQAVAYRRFSEAPRGRAQAKIESRLEQLEACGAPVRLPEVLVREVKDLRAVRNALTHHLWLDPARVPSTVRQDLGTTSGGDLVPTAALVRRALLAVDQVIAAVDVALMLLAERLDEVSQPGRLSAGPDL